MKKCYVIPTESCTCDCTFCISKSRDYHKKLISVSGIASVTIYQSQVMFTKIIEIHSKLRRR